MSGECADFTSFSFHAVKNLTTAEGGGLVWRDIPGVDNEELYHKLMLLSLHGQSKDALAKTKLGAWEYDIIGTYYKCNMTDIMAAVGLVQFARYPKLLARRKEIIERYNKGLAKLPAEALTHFDDTVTSSGHLYLVRLTGKVKNTAMILLPGWRKTVWHAMSTSSRCQCIRHIKIWDFISKIFRMPMKCITTRLHCRCIPA